ncbi:alpha/beta fold hydrolase, partial [Pantoea agglomerans]|uniref:alpha/beta fold hydrolase n=1 Tax=Enterobacter agglomerans TaxID=549 RepID=UPI0030CA182D
QHFGALTLEQMAAQLLPALPPQAIVVGWSLGGLVATQLALIEMPYAEKTSVLLIAPVMDALYEKLIAAYQVCKLYEESDA